MRTTAVEVLAIMDEVTLESSIVDKYITGANALVNQILSNSGLGDSLLTEIEKWLSAHMIASTRERAAKKEGAGGAFIEYTGVYGEGLKSTAYGQMVLTLDSSGAMASLSGKAAKIKAIKSFD